MDPAEYLPVEIFISILQNCSVQQLAKCQLVSTIWRSRVLASSELWADLDYGNTVVPVRVIVDAVSRSRSSLNGLVICELDDESQAVVEEKVMRQEWTNLRKLQVSSQILGSVAEYACFNHLVDLTIHIKSASQFVQDVLLARPMPSLQSLTFAVDWFELFRDTVRFEVPVTNTITVPSIKSLHIGSPEPPVKYLYRYLTSPLYGSNKWILVLMAGLQRLLFAMPNLEQFSMIRMDAFAIGSSGFQHTAELDLTHLVRLKRVVIKYSMVPQVLLNTKCEVLEFVCSTEIPRFVSVAEGGYLRDVHLADGPSLSSLTLADVAYPFLGNFALLRLLQSVNTRRLVTLDLSSVCYHRRLIDYGSTVVADAEMVAGSHVPEGRFTLVDNIIALCPRLKKLVLGNTITDESIALFRSLEELEHVEIAYSSGITRLGIFALLRIPLSASDKFVDTAEFVQNIVISSPIKRIVIRDCSSIYSGLLDPLMSLGVDVEVYSTTTFTINGDIDNLDLLTHYRWHVHGYDRIRDLPQLRSRPDVVRSRWRGDLHWI